jgi:hypothetical protein
MPCRPFHGLEQFIVSADPGACAPRLYAAVRFADSHRLVEFRDYDPDCVRWIFQSYKNTRTRRIVALLRNLTAKTPEASLLRDGVPLRDDAVSPS